MADLDALMDLATMIVSNSSSYMISEIIAGLPLWHAEHMASLHSSSLPHTEEPYLVESNQL